MQALNQINLFSKLETRTTSAYNAVFNMKINLFNISDKSLNKSQNTTNKKNSSLFLLYFFLSSFNPVSIYIQFYKYIKFLFSFL